MVGGDGTMAIAAQVAESGVRVVGVPKTIDRDVIASWTTFGFDSAVNTAVDAIDKLHTTAMSHQRIMVCELMGRNTGWIALYSGIAGGVCAIVIPEIPYDVEVIADHIRRREAEGHTYHIVVCAEGARPKGGAVHRSARTGRYHGLAEDLAADLSERTGKEARSVNPGHMLRGGAPTVSDRVLALWFGSAAVTALHEGASGVMIAFMPPGFERIPLLDVAARTNFVPTDAHEIMTARNMGICFGE